MGLRGEQGAAAGSRDAAPEWPSMVQRVARVRGARAIAFALAAALCCGSPRAAGAARCSDFEENGAACGSGAASLWRIAITPLDTFKTTFQVRRVLMAHRHHASRHL